jgi:hypothetical protein
MSETAPIDSREPLPAGPWGIIITAKGGDHPGSGHVYLCDGNGRKIASIWGTPAEKIAIANVMIDTRERTP